MSLATSCPACSTTFRVAEEQLQASEGWVRCGQCHQIFDALERLFDLDHPPQHIPPEASSAGTTTLPESGAAEPAKAQAADWAETRPALFGDENVLLQPSQSNPTDVNLSDSAGPSDAESSRALAMHDGATLHLLEEVGSAVPAQDAAARPALPTDIENDAASATVFLVESGMEDENGADDAATPKLIQELEPSSTVQGPAASPVVKATETTLTSTKSTSTAEAVPVRRTKGGASNSATAPQTAGTTSPTQTRNERPAATTNTDTAGLPAFIRKADQDARWRKPWIRVFLSLIGVLALLALVSQVGYQWRDLIAAQFPVLRPALTLGCQWMDCQIAPPRALEAVVVDNTALTRPPGMTEGYRLSIALRNKAEHDIAAPSMELTLTDAANAVLSRRVLNPSDFGVAQPVLKAQADAAWQLVFLSTDTRITGYTVRAFYP